MRRNEKSYGGEKVQFASNLLKKKAVFLQLKELNERMAKALADWHEYLELLEALKGKELDFSMKRWENWHNEYIKVLKQFIG